MSTLAAWCEDGGTPYSSVPVGTIKKHATGNGSASKKAVMAAMVERFGIIPDDDNHADALAINSYALNILHGRQIVG